MSFILSYETNVTADLFNLWDNIFVSVEIEDDLGNKYTSLNDLNHGWRTDLTRKLECHLRSIGPSGKNTLFNANYFSH